MLNSGMETFLLTVLKEVLTNMYTYCTRVSGIHNCRYLVRKMRNHYITEKYRNVAILIKGKRNITSLTKKYKK